MHSVREPAHPVSTSASCSEVGGEEGASKTLSDTDHMYLHTEDLRSCNQLITSAILIAGLGLGFQRCCGILRTVRTDQEVIYARSLCQLYFWSGRR